MAETRIRDNAGWCRREWEIVVTIIAMMMIMVVVMRMWMTTTVMYFSYVNINTSCKS